MEEEDYGKGMMIFQWDSALHCMEIEKLTQRYFKTAMKLRLKL